MSLDSIVSANRAGEAVGIVSVCSAHPRVLQAALLRGLSDGSEVLIEATCNQVNHEGGYTGLAPTDFRRLVEREAAVVGFPLDRLILGGDHLGPNPWRSGSAARAMASAEDMVAAYAAAGFRKLHLDASMACADDDGVLDDRAVAERAAQLCRAAEGAAGSAASGLRYVIGTEVPTPGGAHEDIDTLMPTSTAALGKTLDAFQQAFSRLDLTDAWSRAVAVVVQPGVEFGHADVIDYDRDKARELEAFAHRLPAGMVFEAHSTDYQREASLHALVEDHFAILKVGPGLTFAMREALFALDMMDRERLPSERRAGLIQALEDAMLDDPVHWRDYYPGSDSEQAFARRFSMSDRSRYYWSAPAIIDAERRLFANIAASPPPLTLIGQYLPDVRDALRAGTLAVLDGEPVTNDASYPPTSGQAMVRHRIASVIDEYARACGGH